MNKRSKCTIFDWLGKNQAGGAASQKNHFIHQRAKFLNGRFKDFDIGVVFFL
jgi:hypothetical protein